MLERSIVIPATDGYQLAATVFSSEAGSVSASIVISAAMATPRRFYAPFARFLAERGILTVTYDYRGIGDSRPSRLRGFDAHLRDWAERDMAGVMVWVRNEHRPQRLFHLGHSLGGQVAGLVPEASIVDAMVTVSAQSGYWRLHPSPEKYRVWFFTHVVFPGLTRLVGYLPWRRLAGGEDLPRRVALEWAAWCRTSGYLLDDRTLPVANYARFTAPILAYSFADDVWGSERSVRVMMSAYTAARVEQRHVVATERGIKSLGHLGFFRPKAQCLWEETIAWLEQHGG